MFSFQAFSQVWSKTHFKADELTNRPEINAYTFINDEIGAFTFWDNVDDQFNVYTKNGIFNYNVKKQTPVVIGLYDKEDKLAEKVEMMMQRTSTASNITSADKKKAKKVIAHIKTDGYIRIIAPIYNGLQFDLKLIPLKKDEVINRENE